MQTEGDEILKEVGCRILGEWDIFVFCFQHLEPLVCSDKGMVGREKKIEQECGQCTNHDVHLEATLFEVPRPAT